MARKLSKREGTLLVVLGVAAALFLYFNSGGKSPFGSGGDEKVEKIEPFGSAPEVMLAMLNRSAEPYDPNGRDLFKYSERPLTPEERAALEAQRRAQQQQQQQAQQRRVEAQQKAAEARRQAPKPAQPTGPRPPQPRFEYLGYLGPKDDLIAVFDRKSGEDPLLLARAGEVVEEEYLLKSINYHTVVLGYTDERFRNQTKELPMKNADR
jgi:hypothetical protein